MKKINKKPILIFLAIVGLLVFLSFIKVLDPVKEKIHLVLNPIANRLYSLSTDINSSYKTQTDKRDLSVVIKDLENEVKKLIAENAKLVKVNNENEVLRKQLNFLGKNEQKYIMANVISRISSLDTADNQSNLIINKGEKDGLRKGLVVVDEEGIVVGKITRVDNKVSQVNLTTNTNCKFAVAIQNKDKTIGTTRGNLGLTINIEFVPQANEINIDDTVVTSNLDANIPKGLVIGKVSQVNNVSNEIWQDVVIEPISDFDRLSVVSILLP